MIRVVMEKLGMGCDGIDRNQVDPGRCRWIQRQVQENVADSVIGWQKIKQGWKCKPIANTGETLGNTPIR